jgi:competence protein CoiA
VSGTQTLRWAHCSATRSSQKRARSNNGTTAFEILPFPRAPEVGLLTMKFAIVGGERAEPKPRIRGSCPRCEEETVAKCGKHVVWHWAHKSRVHCDTWWEPETEWHRQWKNRFSTEWQEIILVDERTGERHIADVRTPGGLVIEFQRSAITHGEVKSRESFYGTMIWVIDGCKSDLDKDHFAMSRSSPDADGLADFRWYGRGQLFARWYTFKPVFVDFGSRQGFWRILRYDPKTKKGLAGLVNIDAFVELASSGRSDFSANGGPAST